MTSAASELSAHRVDADGLHAYAASLMGSSHGRACGLREDAYALAPVELEHPASGRRGLVVAVADGLGSTRHAHAAALLAAEAAVSRCRDAGVARAPWPVVAAGVVKAAGDALTTRRGAAARAQALGTQDSPGNADAKHDRPGTTLALALVVPEGGGCRVRWLAYGDSAVLVLRWEQRRWEWLSAAPDEALVTNVTAALPGSPERALLGEVSVGAEDVVVLASDGVWHAIADLPDDFARGTVDVWQRAVSAAKYATLLDFQVAGSADDRTLLMVRPAPLIP